MRPAVVIRLLALAASVVAATPRAARAQQSTDASPSACVSVAGPDSGGTELRRSTPATRVDDTGATTLRILASVSADEVRFARSPRVCVRLTGDARLDSVHVTARRNLASPVVAGTSYRNVFVAVEILGRLNAECIAARITGEPTGATRCASLDARGRADTSTSGSTPPAVPPRR